MAIRQAERDRVARQFERIKSANEVYERWHARFRPDRLIGYYCGDQWPEFQPPEHNPRYRPYVINLVFPTIETQQPALLFYRPTVQVEPKPPYGDDPQSQVAQRAKLCADTLQTYVDKPEVGFKQQTLLALRDAQYRFGVVEIGYTADWIDNPHAGKPVLKDQSEEPYLDRAGEAILHPSKVPATDSEQLYVRQIDPACFRVSASNRPVLLENDWVGYYDWQYVEDVKRNPKYSRTRDLKPSGQFGDPPEASRDPATTLDRQASHRDMVQLWKLWDLRSKTRCVVAQGHPTYLLENEPWSYLPFAVLKFYEIPQAFYPLPPVANWIDAQNEINETREARRVHRRRFARRYVVRQNTMDDTELEKITMGGDGTVATHKGAPGEQPLHPVPDAALGMDVDKHLAESRDDFMQISGVGAEARGVAESDTATQANIVDVRQRIRETASRVQVADWLSEICRLLLLTIREKMQLPFWIRDNVDLVSADPAELQRIIGTWQQITAQELGSTLMDVSVDVTSLSPVSQEQRAAQWNQLLALITNPALALVLGQSEVLLRKTLKYYGVTSEGDIREIQNVLRQTLMMQVAAQTGGAGAPPDTGPGQPAGLPASSAGIQ